MVTETIHNRTNILLILALDVSLLVIILAGVFRAKSSGLRNAYSIILSQGVVWLALATISEIPPAVRCHCVVVMSILINTSFSGFS